MWLETDRSSSLELSLGRKVRVEESVFQKGSTWEQNLQAGFLARNRSSQWPQLRPWSAHFPMGDSGPSAQKSQAPGNSQQEATRWRDLSTHTCFCPLGECDETVSCA